jgi:transposase-like protein
MFEIQLHQIVDVGRCHEILRSVRWSETVKCYKCGSTQVIKNGKDSVDKHIQHYKCKTCNSYFDDLTDTIFSGSHFGIDKWICILYLMNLNVSNLQIAKELDLNVDSVANMRATIREGVVKKKPDLHLSGQVEADECYVVAGHKGQPLKVQKAGRPPRRRSLKGKRGRGTAADEKNPILGLVERKGLVRLAVLDNVKQQTIEPIIKEVVKEGAILYTDEYCIYNNVASLGYEHKQVNHGKGEYARDEDGDGFHEVHCNTQEGVWSLLCSWLRPHRGVSQEKLPFYVGFFEWIHNLRKRGKKAVHETFCLLLKPDLRKYEDCLTISPI